MGHPRFQLYEDAIDVLTSAGVEPNQLGCLQHQEQKPSSPPRMYNEVGGSHLRLTAHSHGSAQEHLGPRPEPTATPYHLSLTILTNKYSSRLLTPPLSGSITLPWPLDSGWSRRARTTACGRNSLVPPPNRSFKHVVELCLLLFRLSWARW